MIKINKRKIKVKGSQDDIMAELAVIIATFMEKFGVQLTNLAIEIGQEQAQENKCIKNQIKRFKIAKTC